MPLFALQTSVCQLQQWQSILPPPLLLLFLEWETLMHRNSLSECDKTNRFENFFPFRGPRWLYRLCVIWEPFFVLSHFSLLINPSPSRCSFDAADGRAVLILSPKKLQRWGTVIVMGTTRAPENPGGEMRGCKTGESPHRRHLKASLQQRRGTLTDKLSVNVQYSSAGQFGATKRFRRCRTNTQTHTCTMTEQGTLVH